MKRFSPLALAVACANAAIAEQLPMEHVLVTTPVHKKAAETALPVTVLNGEEMRRQAASTIGDTLSNSPGLANASFGPGVGQPVIRGQAGPRVTVLQNGTSSADASNISADHAVSVEPLLADSVEVLRGPATLLYGGGAIGGVVNVIDNRIPTRRIEGVEGAGEVRHDTASGGDTAVLRLEGGGGDFAFHVDGLYRDWGNIDIPGSAALAHEEEHDESEEDHDHEDEAETTDGYVANTDGVTKSATIGGAWHFASGFFGLAVNRLENEYGIPPGAHSHGHAEEEHDHEEEAHAGEDHDDEEDHEPGEENIRLNVEQTRYDMALHLHEPLPGVEQFRGFLTYTDYEHQELEGAEVGTEYSNESWESRLEFVHTRMGRFHGSFGLQAGGGEFSAVGEESFIPRTDSRELGIFLVEDYHAERFSLEGGLRVDWDQRDPAGAAAPDQDFTSFSVSGSALVSLTQRWQLGVSLMRAERAPAIEELYSNVTVDHPDELVVHAATRSVEIGDPELDTEVSNNLDVSLSWVNGEDLFSVTTYYNDFSDYINLVNTGDFAGETPVYRYAHADAEFYGIEVEGDFGLFNVADGMVRLALTGDLIHGELENGDDIPRLPPVRLGAKLSWESETWNVYARVLDADEQDNPGANEEETPGYTRWDAGIEFRKPLGEAREFVAFVNLRNATDEEIRLSTSFLRDFAPEPGRSLEAGVRFLF